ncbi:Ribonuclease H2 non-catalytic subunit (Ylr154p-like) [Lotmaria passim]
MDSTASSSPSSAGVAFHSLPIQTDFDGTTDVRENFTSVMTQDLKHHLWHATLRGRSLVGKEVHLPDDYAVALVAVSDNAPTSFSTAFTAKEKECAIDVPSRIFVKAAAPSFIQWEHDRPPAAAATVPQWIALASIIHASD